MPLPDTDVALPLEEPVHVIPAFGKEHFCTQHCWCHPELANEIEVIFGEHFALIWLHRVLH